MNRKVPKRNTSASEFKLLSADGREVKLSDYRGKNVVLAFYPADWTPVCTSEMVLFQQILEEIHSYNAEVLGLSTDTHYSHRAWGREQHITFPLLSDFWPHGEVARQYGVFREDDGICDRALFFIDGSGTIRDTWVAEDPNIGPGMNIVFDALASIQGAPKAKQQSGLKKRRRSTAPASSKGVHHA